MKSVCSVHEQAYDVGSQCPYCEVPEAPVFAPVSHIEKREGYHVWSVYGQQGRWFGLGNPYTGTLTYLDPQQWAGYMTGIKDDK